MSVWGRLRPRRPAPRPADQPADQPAHRSTAEPTTTPDSPPRAALADPGLGAWAGARWQVELLPPGAPRPSAASLDATTTPEAHAWAATIRERLAAAGVEAQLRQDDGEDGRGNPTTYDELLVTVGEGHMALAFWRGVVAWTVDVFPDQADRGTVAGVASRTLAAAQEITGYVLDPERLGPDERSLLGG